MFLTQILEVDPGYLFFLFTITYQPEVSDTEVFEP